MSNELACTLSVEAGDLYPVWWATGTRDAQGTPLARVLEVLPYTGRGYFNAVLRLHAPNTRRGWLDMAVRLDTPATQVATTSPGPG